MTKPSSVIFPALIAAVCFLIADKTEPKEIRQSVLFFVGLMFLIIALYFALVIMVERGVIEKLTKLVTSVMYHDVAMAYAVAGMDKDKLAYLAPGYIMEVNKAIIRHGGVELDPDWVIKYLQKAEAYYPEYPSYRNHKEGEKENRENIVEYNQQRALRGWLRGKGKIMARDSQTDVWANGWTPASTLRDLGYMD